MTTSLQSKARVKETSTTTGTGAYTLAGAVAGFRALGSAYTAAAGCYVPYVAVMDSDYEIGIGELTTNTNLNRSTILESSNAGTAVNWAAGPKTIFVGNGGLHQLTARNKFDGTALPDNVTTGRRLDGYGPGSLWLASLGIGAGTRTVMQMNLAGISDAGVGANWYTIEGLNPIFVTDGSGTSGFAYGYNLASSDDGVLNEDIYNVFGTGGGGKGRWSFSRLHGIWGLGDYGGHQLNDAVMLYQETTNNTPTVVLDADGLAYSNITVEPDSCVVCTIDVVARNNADGVNSAWQLRFVVARAGTADPAIIGSVSGTAALAQDAGAAAWAVSVGIDTTHDSIQLTVTGQAGKTIRWTGAMRATQVAFT